MKCIKIRVKSNLLGQCSSVEKTSVCFKVCACGLLASGRLFSYIRELLCIVLYCTIKQWMSSAIFATKALLKNVDIT